MKALSLHPNAVGVIEKAQTPRADAGQRTVNFWTCTRWRSRNSRSVQLGSGLVFALSLCLGCRAASSDGARPAASTDAADLATTPDAKQALEELDQRRPVPLLPMMAQHQKENMRAHLEGVRDVVAAAAVSDFESVAVAAKRMGFSQTMGRMCEHMGAGAPGFTEQALIFHHTADEIAVAAQKQDGAAVLAALSKTLGTCTSCHATYKQQLVMKLPD